jgi:small subunit ribosomal protein S2
MKDLLEAGVHFGHKSSSWDPRMKRYIFMKRKGVHIIDLQKTLSLAEEAHNYIKNEVANGKRVLFVGTKKQARQSIEENALASSQYYISQRWIGGLLTNFKTVRQSLAKLKQLDTLLNNPEESARYSKKMLINKTKERDKLLVTFGGIREMKKLPDILFVVDAFHEAIAIAEARRMGIPVVALVDTNSNPDIVDVVIPGNDDAIRSISLFIGYIASAVNEGRAMLPDSGTDADGNAEVTAETGRTLDPDREIDMVEVFSKVDLDLEKR